MEATIVPVTVEPDVKCGYMGDAGEQLLMQQQELLNRQQLLHQQQQQAIQQQAYLRKQELQQAQKQCQQRQEPPQQQQQHRGYSTCGGEEGVLPAGPLFVEKMSLLMEQLATCGDESGRRSSVATRFDSVCAPATSISAYIPRLYRHFRCSEEVFVFALIYLDRVIRANHIKINALNIHRLVLAASVIGVKFVEDVRYSNRYYARVGGVGLAELNRLELAFLKLVKFDLTVSKEEYAVYRSTVLLACPRRPVPSNTEQQQQQAGQQQAEQQQQQHVACDDVSPMDAEGTACEAVSAAPQQTGALDVSEHIGPTTQAPPQPHKVQPKAPRGLLAVSAPSTVSTTPETAHATSAAAAPAAAAVAASVLHSDQQPSASKLALQRHAVVQQEEAYRRQLQQQQQQQAFEQQQWQSGGVRLVAAQPKQQQEQQQLSLQQQARLVLESQQYTMPCWDCAATVQQQKLAKPQNRICSQERLMEQQQQQRQLLRAQQLLLLREYHQQQQMLLEQQQQQQLHLLRQQQLLLQENDFMVNDAAVSPSNSYTPTSRSNSRDSLSMCGGFSMEPEDKMTTAASDEELHVASPVSGLRDVLAAEVP